MPSGAKFAIQGFLYQFNKTLLEILNSDDATSVTIEGIVEDIDLSFEDGSVEAIQCKYHESRESYSPSLIYRPLLQMIEHYVCSGLANIRYRLFVHVSGDRPESRNIHICEIKSALGSAQAGKLKEKVDRTDFDAQAFADVCILEFGPSLDELGTDVMKAFKCTSLPSDSIDTLYYPNAINEIADRSVLENDSSRTMTKPEFLKILQDIRKTAVSRWTLAIKTREKVLRSRRSQLKTNLSKNSRKRCVIVSQNAIECFEQEIVLFVQEFIGKYHFKPNHEKPPTFHLDCDQSLFMEIRERLHQKGIKFTTGLEINDKFDLDHFYREPVTQVSNSNQVQADFQIRLSCHVGSQSAIEHKGFDDVYVISDTQYDFWDKDVEIEILPIDTFGELDFLLGLSDDFR